MKRLNPVCINCKRQISMDSIKRGDGKILEQEGGKRVGMHTVECKGKSLKQIRSDYEAQVTPS